MPNGQPEPDPMQRLQKVLAEAGLGSRRQCEELITDGRVDVDRTVVTELGTRVDPTKQAVRVDGMPLKKRPRRRYFAVNKPSGVLSTSHDQWQRLRVIDLVNTTDRLFTIGRLDKDSTGLILVTNDGEMANHVTHPRYRVEKTYHVTVAGSPNHEVIRRLRHGMHLSEGLAKPESVVIKKRLKQSTVLEIVLAEGRNREIRRMLARVEHKVMRLQRIAIGPIRLGLLPVGTSRELTRDEVKMLRGMGTTQKSGSSSPQKKRKTSSRSGSTVRKKSSGTKITSQKASKTTSKKFSKQTAKKATKKGSGKPSLPKMGVVIGGGGGSSSGSSSSSGGSGSRSQSSSSSNGSSSDSRRKPRFTGKKKAASGAGGRGKKKTVSGAGGKGKKVRRGRK